MYQDSAGEAEAGMECMSSKAASLSVGSPRPEQVSGKNGSIYTEL